MLLSQFPRIPFCHKPTPLEPMPRLTERLGGPTLYVKRDDCTGLASGGNKTRKLEFLIADAIDQGCDTVIAVGAVQSNHTRQTAAAAAKSNLRCEVLLERRVPDTGPDYERTGNVLLDRMLGATVHIYDRGTDLTVEAEALASKIRSESGVPYVIPGGGSSPVGALGYVGCAEELVGQAREMNISIDHVVHATGSGGTQAGLVAGFNAMGSDVPVMGISIRFPARTQIERVFNLASETTAILDAAPRLDRDRVAVNDSYIGPGYGQVTPEMIEAVTLAAQDEGLLLDPVYTGKGLAGLIGLVRKGHFKTTDTVVFIHTGGSPALFAYEDTFSGAPE